MILIRRPYREHVSRYAARTCATLVALLLLADSGLGQEPQRTDWLTGAEFQRQLESRVGIAWAAEPLRQKLNNLSETLRIAIWLDRRVDPSQEPEIQLTDVSLQECLEQVAARVGTGFGTVGPVVYLGPPHLAGKIATLAALRNSDIARLPAAVRQRLTRTASWKWEALAEPRELLASIAREHGVTLHGLQDIPHDLWPAVDLPPLSFAERLTLVLAGFDLTFELDASGSHLRFVPIPESVELQRTYPWRNGRIDLADIQRAVPQASLKREGAQLHVRGRLEDHATITRLLAMDNPQPSRKSKTASTAAGPARTVYSMQGPALLGDILKTLEVQAKLRVTVDPQIQGELYRRVTFQVKNASLEELLSAVLKDTGLSFELNGQHLTIRPGGSR